MTHASILPSNHHPLEDPAPTPVERAYLEVISYLAARREPVIAAQLARWLRVRPPTVTKIVQRLEQKQLIVRASGTIIQLTPAGSALADAIIRRHRLIECFLYNILQVPWHEIHREATRLEPHLSPALEARIVAMVGGAKTCPHGNPIPGQGAPALDDRRLTSVPVGAWFVITRIDEEAGEDACTLQLLWTRGLLPGTPLVRLPDLIGEVAVRRADRRVVLSQRVAGMLWGTVEL